MKYIFFIIAAILFLIGAVLFWGFRPFGTVHILFIIASFFVIIGILYNTYTKPKKTDKE